MSYSLLTKAIIPNTLRHGYIFYERDTSLFYQPASFRRIASLIIELSVVKIQKKAQARGAHDAIRSISVHEANARYFLVPRYRK